MAALGSRTGVLLGLVASLGCASQHDTAQALTIAGAAAVVIGASMAADEQCYGAGPGEGGVQGYCAPGLSKGARTAGKGLAVAGVGLAAAGYALKPKGPDRMQRPVADPDAAQPSPYRLIRHDPPASESEAEAEPEASVEAASSSDPACRPDSSHVDGASDASSCKAPGVPEAAAPDDPSAAPPSPSPP